VVNSTVSNNFAGALGGGFGDENAQGTLNIIDSLFTGNTTAGNGGGVVAGGPQTTITSSEIDNNSSGGTGGGVFANGQGLLVQSSTFSGNTSSGNGGGLEIETTGPNTTLVNTTITGNLALSANGANGGGVDVAGSGALTLLNDTINLNQATNGGGVYLLGPAVSAENTIIAGNIAPSGADVATIQTFTASMNSAQVVSPPGSISGATGLTTLVLGGDGTTLSFTSFWTGLQGYPRAVELHNAPAGQNGPIATDANGNPLQLAMVPQTGTFTLGPQTFTVTPAFISQLQAGNIYVLLTSNAAPVGEIRGQLTPAGGHIIDLGGNLIGTGDPLLGPLTNNGGPTVGGPGQSITLQTELPQPGSPAIGNGNFSLAPPIDARGLPSVVNGAINSGAASQAIFVQPAITIGSNTTSQTTTTSTTSSDSDTQTTTPTTGSTTTTQDPTPATGSTTTTQSNTTTTQTTTGQTTGTVTSGNPSSSGSSSLTSAVTVTKAPTTIKVTSSASTAVFGQTVTLRATVSGQGTPTGTVTFKLGSKVLGTGTLSGGVATLKTAALPVGAGTVTVVYNGDGHFATTTSAGLKVTVHQAATTTVLGTSSGTATFGQVVTLTATVKPAAGSVGTPTGKVTFYDGNRVLGTVSLVKGVAHLLVKTLTRGTHHLHVVYSHDANFLASTSSVLNETIR